MVDHNLTNVISSPLEDSHPGTSHSPAPVEKWQDLFASNHNTITGPRLPHFSSSCNDLPCDFSWKCEASLAIHEFGWLVYIFKNVDDKLVVLANGPYLIYGRPLILKVMPEYFDFGTDEMSVLVELDLLADLKSFIVINLPNGAILNQPVIYEMLPRFCKLCKVLGHNTGTCTSHLAPVVKPLGKKSNPPITANRGRSVFDRLGTVTEPSLGKTKGQIGETSQNYDPMTIEAAVASGGICTSECNPPIINNGKESVGAVLHSKDPHVVPVVTTTMRGLNSPLKQHEMARLMQKHKFDVCGLLETKLVSSKL
ncbi:hypothetical protein NC651_032927 [Populus alba x Populus x berolinensis]|nr:hypothetical protein NC651_032927 [Populus alba x Populus x berolinensis]